MLWCTWCSVCERCRCCGVSRSRVFDEEPFAELSGKCTQALHPPKTARRPLIPNRILRTLHVPALPPAENRRWSLIPNKILRKLARARAGTRPKQREGRRFLTEFSIRSARQSSYPSKTTRWASIPNGIRRTLHAPALPPIDNSATGVDSKQNSRTLHVPALPHAQNSENVVDSKRTLQAPALPRAQNSEMSVDSKQNSQDAPRASAATRSKQI